jgi:hypothetical protein
MGALRQRINEGSTGDNPLAVNISQQENQPLPQVYNGDTASFDDSQAQICCYIHKTKASKEKKLGILQTSLEGLALRTLSRKILRKHELGRFFGFEGALAFLLEQYADPDIIETTTIKILNLRMFNSLKCY